jgi:putative ABC transport system permease protein
MSSALWRKSVRDLTRRRSRTFFAVATLALGVGSVGIFAVPALMDRAMHSEVAAGKLPDLVVHTSPLRLDAAQLARLRALPNVQAVEPESFFNGRVYVGARRAPAYVRGVRDFAHQTVDVVHVASGAAPRAGTLLVDVQDARQGLLDVGTGSAVRIIAAGGTVRLLRVSGEGRNLNGGQDAIGDNTIVLYATPATVAALSGEAGYQSLAFRVADAREPAMTATIAAVRRALAHVPGFTGFTWMPDTRTPGDWPGKSDLDTFTKFFYVITLLAVLSAFVLIANTMSTLVAEQTAEIGTMKAVGGRRRQIASAFVRTALLLGALGTAAGLVLGFVLANALVRFLGSTFFAIDVGLGVDWRVLLASALLGLLGPALAALPAIRRAVRVPLREALEATGSAVGNQDAGDRMLQRVRFLPRTAQIGLRNVGRRRRRSLSTAVMVSLAVATLLAILGLASGVAEASHTSWGDHGEDVKVTTTSDRALDADGVRLLRTTPGVASIEPMFDASVSLAGKDGFVWAVRSKTMFHYRIAAGRWYTPAEERMHAHVAVIERDLARRTGTHVGDRIRVETAAGPVTLRVIGVAANQQENGTAVFVPRETMRALLHGAAADDYWVRTTSHAHAAVDRTTTRIEDRLTGHGYAVGTEIEYVAEADEVASYRTITTTLAVFGFLVVAISMVGLANAITMSVIERTREVGILRTIGARARDVRRIFAAESAAIALIGWLIGVPLGYLLDRLLVWLVRHVVEVDIPFAFPLTYVAIALVGTVLLALLITLLPIRRAVRYRPGNALRYA